MPGWISLMLLLPMTGAVPDAKVAPAAVGKKIENFTLQDYRGKSISLTDLKDYKAIVVVFVGAECPLAKLYAPKLQAMANDYEKEGVAFLAIDSNSQDSLADIENYVLQHEFKIPLLKDPGNRVADQFDAKRTPEVFVLDKDHVVRYHGRVDDQYVLGRTSSYAKYAVNRHDLVEAIKEMIAEKPVTVTSTEPAGCIIGRTPKKSASGDVTYTKQISRIMQERCVECHRKGEVAPFTLTNYEEVVGWGETIREVVDQNRMPPWFADPAHGEFANDARLTPEEKATLATWIANGSPEGDPADLAPPKEYLEGWRIPKPDQVIMMSPRPRKIQAEGTVPYQYLVADPGWKEGKWIRAAEARPGNRQVVHHIIAFIAPREALGAIAGFGGGGGRRDGAGPAGDRREGGDRPEGIGRGRRGLGGGGRRGGGLTEGSGSGLAAYAPGNSPTVMPEGSAIYAPAGSLIIFQMHYTPNGSPQEDLSSVGVVFADPKTVKRKIVSSAAMNRRFLIPPGDANYRVDAIRPLEQDVLLLTMSPHMHLRGKSFRFTALYPDGKSEILLDVPHYDPDWQLTYELKEPKLLPKGTRIECVAHFDNSPENLANPDPTKSVSFGPQTWDEMMIGFFRALPTHDLATPGDPGEPRKKVDENVSDRPISLRESTEE